MAFTSYSELQTTIANYLARTDLNAQIPDFIRLAEVRLNRDLRIRQMSNVATTTTTNGDPTVELPIDYNMIRDIHLNTNPVATLSYESPSNFYRNARTSTIGQPKFYTILAQEIQLSPVPDGEYEIQMLYYSSVQALSDLNPSNVFLATCPDLLLYGALAEAEPYLMNDERVQTWKTFYDVGVQALTQSDDEGEYSGSPLAITVSSR